MRWIAAAAMLIALNVGFAAPVVNSITLNDKRILDLSGTYNFSSGEVNIAVTIVQSPDGTVGAGAFVTGAGEAKTIVTAGQLKANGETVSFSAKGTQDGITFKMKASGQPRVSSLFNTEITLKGPNVSLTINSTFTPTDGTRGMKVTTTAVNGVDTWQFSTPFFLETGNLTLTGKNKNSTIKVSEPFVKATFPGRITKSNQLFTWISGPSSAQVKFGKYKLVLEPWQVTAVIYNDKL